MTDAARQDGAKRARGKQWIYRYPLPIVLGREEAASASDPASSLTTTSVFSIRYYFSTASVPRIQGRLDAASQGVWVTRKEDVETCWTRGFFGKGQLSRSEPSWIDRRCRELGYASDKLSPEELTALRRSKRKLEKSLKAAGGGGGEGGGSVVEGVEKREESVEAPQTGFEAGAGIEASTRPLPHSIDNLEHLHLTLEEAFFLQWAIGCLDIRANDEGLYDSLGLWQRCLAIRSPAASPALGRCYLRPDHPFVIDYLVYHHYRSLGWCVRSGLKFCVDYILYKRGPVFHHAEFAVVIIPEYEDPTDATTGSLSPRTTRHTWTWLSGINRISAQVKKTVLLVYLSIPSSSLCTPEVLWQDPRKALEMYHLREVTVKRFAPSRNRD